MFAWAKCMREHGVDMPDPKVDGQGGVSITVGGGSAGSAGDPSSTAFQDASKACQSLMPNAGTAPAASPDPAMQDKLLAYAKCMREHGVDMPDPKFGSDGGVSIQVGGAIDPSSDTFSKADKTCGGTGTGGFSVGSSSAPGTQP